MLPASLSPTYSQLKYVPRFTFSTNCRFASANKFFHAITKTTGKQSLRYRPALYVIIDIVLGQRFIYILEHLLTLFIKALAQAIQESFDAEPQIGHINFLDKDHLP